MIYQKLLSGEHPYHIFNLSRIKGFERHRHPEIEICYCLEGTYSVIINNVKYEIEQGEMVVVGSMAAHEIPPCDENCSILIVEMGPVFLSEFFDAFAKVCANNPVLKIDKKSDSVLFELLQEILVLKKNPVAFSKLIIKGNLYKIAACILNKIEAINSDEQSVNTIRDVANIDKALDVIYKNYNCELTLDEVAKMCGYSKSNFCKIFKKITGDTFHNVLNNYRINMACVFLKETNYSIESIAYEVGFADSKTLCRVFKSVMGVTAGAYRKTVL